MEGKRGLEGGRGRSGRWCCRSEVVGGFEEMVMRDRGFEPVTV